MAGARNVCGASFTVGMDEETLEIRAVGVTTSNVGDAPMLPDLLEQIPPDQDIATVTADGAYDTRRCHNVIAARGAAAIIPPRKNAQLGVTALKWHYCPVRANEWRTYAASRRLFFRSGLRRSGLNGEFMFHR